ncbi:MAG: OmpA-OmpF porin, OOP family [Candidatus Nitrotoga sp. SPKER]|nr:MAG: OmpA-OmpF porin, OOP family [Candidatus Nitrotoga sp. SPKER]
MKKIACAIVKIGSGTLLVISTATAAFGQPAYYLGGSVGQSKYKDIPQGLRNVDDTDTGYKVYGGYQINPNWGVEATYFDLGKFTGNDTAFNGSSVVPVNASAKVQAWGLAGVFTAPITSGFSVFGKLGFTRSELKTNASGLNFTAHQKESRTGANYGVGAKYDFTPNFAVRAEWERLNKVGEDATTGETDMDFLSAGLTFKF